jgi:hypothetical protein
MHRRELDASYPGSGRCGSAAKLNPHRPGIPPRSVGGPQLGVLRLWEASSKETVAADLADLELQAKTSRGGTGKQRE